MKKNIDLLNGPIFTSLTRLALPIMATSLVQMAYNLTDMAWIGRVGAESVAAVGTAGMYTWLSQGVAMLPKMGGQIKVAHSLGEERPKEAAIYAQGALQMGMLFALLYGSIAVIFAKPLIAFFGLSDLATIANAEIYLKITCGAILFSYLNTILTGIFTAQGDSKTPFLANFIGLLVNMILDPVLIFGIGPIPKMGVAGAAIATVTAQMIVTAVFVVATGREKTIFCHVHLFRKTPYSYLETITHLGLPAAIQNLLYTGISMVLTRFVAAWGDKAVAVQRIGSQIESISWMTAEGFGAAINSFVGQNYAAGKNSRVRKGYHAATGVMFVWGLLCTFLLIFFARPIFSLFINDPEILPMGIDYLVVLGVSQMFMCIELTTIGALSGMGRTFLCSVISILLTSARIPLAILFGHSVLGLNGIWWAFTVSSVAKGIVFFICFMLVSRKLTEDIR
ncbi:MAG: MATE family efflux transporter [Hungatella sp.]